MATPLTLGLFLLLLSASCSAMNYHGVNFFAFQAHSISSPSFIAEFSGLQKMGVDFVGVNFELTQPSASSNNVGPGAATPTNEDFSFFVNAAHSYGFRVLFKPLVLCGHNCIFTNVTPSDPATWFANYEKFLIPFAQLCASLRVEALSVGLELMHLSGNASITPLWRDLIAKVRSVYGGKLTYCSVMYPAELQNVLFWDALDFISMDTYVPLMSSNVAPLPTVQSMINTFSNYFSHVYDWLQKQPANVSSLPLVLTEVGYPSSIEGLVVPWVAPPECTGTFAPNFTLQEMAFSALFDTVEIHELPLDGIVVFWIDMPDTEEYYPERANNTYACGWTPRYKPAECVIAQAFGGTCASVTLSEGR